MEKRKKDSVVVVVVVNTCIRAQAGEGRGGLMPWSWLEPLAAASLCTAPHCSLPEGRCLNHLADMQHTHTPRERERDRGREREKV